VTVEQAVAAADELLERAGDRSSILAMLAKQER
jgi:hypothetical protein